MRRSPFVCDEFVLLIHHCRAPPVSLRLGHARVLTTHRVVIHCAHAAPLPLEKANVEYRLATPERSGENSNQTCRDRRPRLSVLFWLKRSFRVVVFSLRLGHASSPCEVRISLPRIVITPKEAREPRGSPMLPGLKSLSGFLSVTPPTSHPAGRYLSIGIWV